MRIINQNDKHEGLELGRFLAAVAVVIYHGLHFFPYTNDTNHIYIKTTEFFSFGHFGVQVFWVFSGFVMHACYGDMIWRGKIKVNTFMLKRIIRLYPLHIITLIILALIQILSYALMDKFHVYQNQTTTNFVCHLLYLNWSANCGGFGFNAPTWSVAIEFYVYFFYFLTLKFFRFNSIYIYFLIILFLFLILRVSFHLFLECNLYFWIGVLSFKIFFMFKRTTFIFFSFFITLIAIYFNVATLVICGSTFLFLIMTDKLTYGRTLALQLGSLSYPIYLIHIPVQVLFLTSITYFNITFGDKLFFFYIIILAIITLLFGKIDKYIQILLRKKFL